MQFDRRAVTDYVGKGEPAFRKGDPSDACPYDRYGDRERQFGHHYWTKGCEALDGAGATAQR
ncbi:hypothetical protein OHB11_39445 [Streptomyces zaomyceticus]|uniref:hypothetical protein n=1 Tax=Streptomyces zaomyceticus TaxID=68286 RepID=UPI0032460198